MLIKEKAEKKFDSFDRQILHGFFFSFLIFLQFLHYPKK